MENTAFIWYPFFFKILAVIWILTTLIIHAQKSEEDGPAGIRQTQYALGTGIRDITRLPDGSLPPGVGTYGLVCYTHPLDTTINRPEEHIFRRSTPTGQLPGFPETRPDAQGEKIRNERGRGQQKKGDAYAEAPGR